MGLDRLEDGTIRLSAPLSTDDARSLRAGEEVVVSGVVHAMRDAAHRRLFEAIERGESLPFDPEGTIVYYTGPTPSRPGRVVGAAGPTTASRMDRFTPMLLERGVRAVIGKGGRGPEVAAALSAAGAVSLSALGGGGALAATRIRAQRVVAFEEFGPEALRVLELDDLPAWVTMDAGGNDHYAVAAAPWRRDDVLRDD
jgi:fumarate hydratase subunit beta